MRRQRTVRGLAAILSAVALTSALLVQASPADAAGGYYLATGTSLTSGASLTSEDGTYTLTMQSDCNLVFSGPSGVLWNSGSAGKGTGCRTTMQTDGNLVVYTNANVAVWNSGTTGHDTMDLLVRSGRFVLLEGGTAFQWWASSPDPAVIPVTGRVTERGGACAAADVNGYEWIGGHWQGMGYVNVTGGAFSVTVDSSHVGRTVTFSAWCSDPGEALMVWLGGWLGVGGPEPTSQNSRTLVAGQTLDLGTLDGKAGVTVSGTVALADGSRIPCLVATPQVCPMITFLTADSSRSMVAAASNEPAWSVSVPPGTYDVELSLMGTNSYKYPTITTQLGRLVVPAAGVSGLNYRAAPGPAATSVGTGPTIVGPVAVGGTLTAGRGDWDTHGYPLPSLQFSCEWWVAGTLRSTSSAFVPQIADAGRTVMLKLTAHRAAFVSTTVQTSESTIASRAVSSLKVTVPKLKAKKPAKLTVTVRSLRTPLGKVTVRLSGKKIGSATLSAARKGVIKVKIKGLKKGTRNLVVTYAGTRSVAASSLTVKAKVR